ncbi:hypothetical protein SAMN05421856_103161 [Chryseobacterium taichungense]|uniref:Uncharacterized protein n=1 Tax=Chryseobacterium taichungense TaxID=295069 RepID=A0A1H7Y9K6_9FLAO|nr:hypothetical protein SAMN05421856_103161 [Chryseobacterium taichungense]
MVTDSQIALISSKWDKILVTSPLKMENKIISGKGWLLELNDDIL